MSITLKINGETKTVDAEPGTPLLWVIRDDLKMTGTKFGCGVASCGACTVHLDGQPVRSCQTYIEDVDSSDPSDRSDSQCRGQSCDGGSGSGSGKCGTR